MKEPKDKRTKAWKEWNAKQDLSVHEITDIDDMNVSLVSDSDQPFKASQGLGDTIENITESTGIKAAVEFFSELTGLDCGCEKRKSLLNEKYRWKAECMVRSEYDWWTKYLKRHNEKNFKRQDIYKISVMYRRLFYKPLHICANCNGAIRVLNDAVENINKIYETYETNGAM